MVMRADVLGRALSDVLLRRPPCPIIYMSPRGRPLTQARAQARFTWARKAAQVAQVYDWVLGRRATRPDPVAGQDQFEHSG